MNFKHWKDNSYICQNLYKVKEVTMLSFKTQGSLINFMF